MDSSNSFATKGEPDVVADLVRVTRVLVLALPIVNLTDAEENHIYRLARYLLGEAERKTPDVQRIQLLGSLLRNQLQQGPASATLGAVLADSFDEALNGPVAPISQAASAHLPGRDGRSRRLPQRRFSPSQPRSAR